MHLILLLVGECKKNGMKTGTGIGTECSTNHPSYRVFKKPLKLIVTNYWKKSGELMHSGKNLSDKMWVQQQGPQNHQTYRRN